MSSDLAHLIHVGTSGWSYPHWRGPFYPADLPERYWLAYYAARLESVEIDNTFYRLPAPHSVQAWRDGVPDDFIFSVKASRYITHMKKLGNPETSLAVFFQRIAGLAPKLGPVLFQLPPRWRLDLPRLRQFLRCLPAGYPCAFEFRDPSWWGNQVLDLLARHDAAFCIHDLAGVLSPKTITCDWAYVRLHGPDGPYRGRYDTAALSAWASDFSAWAGRGHRVFCYFDNDQDGQAVINAQQLLAMLR
jgi:uncharacterized protein YecE (DUF72 family)